MEPKPLQPNEDGRYTLTEYEVLTINRQRRQAAWEGRDLSCKCDPHIEYCDHCFPPEFRKGGMWDGF